LLLLLQLQLLLPYLQFQRVQVTRRQRHALLLLLCCCCCCQVHWC
jgi:hypothetical protein